MVFRRSLIFITPALISLVKCSDYFYIIYRALQMLVSNICTFPTVDASLATSGYAIAVIFADIA